MPDLILPGRKALIYPDPREKAAIDAAMATHVGAGDPHTGYRLESADHSHQSTGLQAGQLDHGLALTGLGDDDHTQYYNATRHSQFHAHLRGERITSAQSINDNTTTTVIWNSQAVEDDVSDVMDLNTSTGVFTINTAGLYLITAWASFDNTATQYLRQFMRFFLNGTTQIQASDGWARNVLGGSHMVLSQVWKFAAADTFTVDVLQDNTNNTAQNLAIGSLATVTRLA